jgi:hypothetical protein
MAPDPDDVDPAATAQVNGGIEKTTVETGADPVTKWN